MLKEKQLNGICIVLFISLPLVAYIIDEPYFITLSTKIVIFAMAGVGLNFVLGFGGLVSLGHAAFFGIGGYISSIIIWHALNFEPIFTWPVYISGSTQWWIIWPIVIAIVTVVSTFIGFFSLRTSGVYFIMITLAFAQMIYYFSISWPTYGGEDGLSIYTRGSIGGFNSMNGLNFYFVCFSWLLISILVSSKLISSSFGLAFKATRENTERVASVGIKTFNIRLIAFIFSGIICGIAGALYADLNRFVSPSILSWHTSGEIMIFVILGGVSRLFGPLLGAMFFVVLEQVLGGITENWQFWLGFILILEVLFSRGGISGLLIREKVNE